MKKYFNLFAFALVALFCATSCSSDDDPTPAPVKKVVKEFSDSSLNDDGSLEPRFNCSFIYLDGTFNSINITESFAGDTDNYTFSLKGNKFVDEEGNVVCQDMKYNADGLLTYCNSIYGEFTLTYSGRRIATCSYVLDDDDIHITREYRFFWEGGKLVSIETKQTNADEVKTIRTTYTYSSVPNQHKQLSHSAVLPFLGNLYMAVPGIDALGIFGDGTDYAVTGYTISEEGQPDEVHVITQTFDSDGYITAEKDICHTQYTNYSSYITYKY